MTRFKYYIYGAIILIGGVVIGWVVKPVPGINGQDDHSSHADAQDMLMTSGVEQIWTCSMHPQIRQNEPGACPICGMDLIPMASSLANDDPTILQMTPEAAQLAQVETTIVGGFTGQMSGSIVKVDGTVELDERSVNSQSVHVSGRIESLFINFEGEYVQSGQKIATIFSTELLAASQELITAAQFENKVTGITDASIQKLKNWKISDAQIEKILSAGQPIETIDIFADYSGYVLNKKASLGDYVRQGQPLYTIGQTGKLWLIFNVYESDLGNIRKGQKVNFTTPSLGQRGFSARITYIEPLLDPATRTAIVRADITNPGNMLKPGMLLKGEIAGLASGRSASAISVPRTAVLWTGNQSVVYVQLPDSEIPTYQYREVVLGDQSGEMIVINRGLEVGEVVVTHGAFAIDASAQLNNNFSMMNKNVTIKNEISGDQGPDFTVEAPDKFKDQLDGLALEYIHLKDAFVDTDVAKASNAAKGVLTKLNEVDMTLISGPAHQFWMEQMNAILAHSTKIRDANDIVQQRDQFDFLSQAIINSLKSFGTNKNTYYVLYCPMVKNNKGAEWLATEAQIRNPYFGDKMLTCGSVKIALTRDYKNTTLKKSASPSMQSHNH